MNFSTSSTFCIFAVGKITRNLKIGIMRKIGFANKMFTLWEVTVLPQYTQFGTATVHTSDLVHNGYLQNICISESKCRKLYPDFDKIFDETLRGKSRSFDVSTNDTEADWCGNGYSMVRTFIRGKYEGLSIDEVFNIDPSYLVWFRDFMNVAGNRYNEILKVNIEKFEPLKVWEEKKFNENLLVLNKTFERCNTEDEFEISFIAENNPRSPEDCDSFYMTKVETSTGEIMNWKDPNCLMHKKFFEFDYSQLSLRDCYEDMNIYYLKLNGKNKIVKNREVTLRVKKTSERVEERQLSEYFKVIEVLNIKSVKK